MRHLSWENFRQTVLVAGQQRVHRVAERPLIELFSDGANQRIGILIEAPEGTAVPADVSRLTFMSARIISGQAQLLLELSTGAVGLFRQFYHFATAVAERVTVDRLPPSEAVDLELKCFADLLAEKTELGLEWQIGLIGELLFLERLVSAHGLPVVNAWIGPAPDPHDFRLESREFEVKTTVASQRVHIINGAGQLLPCDGCSLWLVSILLGPAGAASGFSLSDLVARLQARFSASTKHEAALDDALRASKFQQGDSDRYTRKFVLRRPIAVASVDSSFPAITTHTIQDALGFRAPRIEGIEYEVNIEGLECEDGTPGFDAAVSG